MVRNSHGENSIFNKVGTFKYNMYYSNIVKIIQHNWNLFNTNQELLDIVGPSPNVIYKKDITIKNMLENIIEPYPGNRGMVKCGFCLQCQAIIEGN